MPFPTIPTAGAGRVLNNVQANATSPRTFPDLGSLTKNAGDLLIAIIAAYQSSAAAGAVFSSWGASFTEFKDVGGTTSNMSIGCAWKISTGSETGTFTVAQAATITGHAAMFLISIPGAHPSAAPEGGNIANGTSTNADPGSFSPSWGADDTLWIAITASGETGTGGAYAGINGPPANYGNAQVGSASGDVVGAVQLQLSYRQLNAASEDVGPADCDLSNARNSALVLAVRPQPPVQQPFWIKPQSWRWL